MMDRRIDKMGLKAAEKGKDSLPEKPWIADNGLRVIGRTNQSIDLTWAVREGSPVMDSSQDLNIKAEVKECFNSGVSEEDWFEVQMNTIGSDDWITCYKGFKNQCGVTNLTPDANVKFRMKKNSDISWGSCITAATDASPPNADDLHRAVSLHAEDMVLRIIGGTMRNNYRGPSIKNLVASHDRNGLTPLMNACQDGQLSLVKTLLQVGAHVNAVAVWNKKTALMTACASGHPSIAQLLSNCGADWSAVDRNGCSALHHAVTSGNIKVVEIALDNSPEDLSNQYDATGWTPILRCVIVGESVDVLKVMLHRGCNPNAIDKSNSKNCLMAAATMGKTEMVRELIDSGADPTFKNLNGKTALDIAVGFEFKEMAMMLEEAIKNVKLYGNVYGAGNRQRRTPRKSNKEKTIS